MKRIPKVTLFDGKRPAQLEANVLLIRQLSETRDSQIERILALLSLFSPEVSGLCSEWAIEAVDFNGFVSRVRKHYCPLRSIDDVNYALAITHPRHGERPEEYCIRLKETCRRNGREPTEFAVTIKGRMMRALDKGARIMLAAALATLPAEASADEELDTLVEKLEDLCVHLKPSELWSEASKSYDRSQPTKLDLANRKVAAVNIDGMTVAAVSGAPKMHCTYCQGTNHTEETCIKRISRDVSSLMGAVEQIRKTMNITVSAVHSLAHSQPESENGVGESEVEAEPLNLTRE